MKQLLWIACAFIGLVAACKKSDKPALAVVATTTPTNITANSAQTGGTITNTGNSPISQSGICWALQSTPTVADSVVNNSQSGPGAFTSSLTNLYANTTYYVRAFVINGVGTAYGNTESFLTAQGVPTLATTAISNNEALTAVSGGSVSNNGGATVTAQGVCWSSSANPTTANSKTSDNVSASSFSDTLTNLTLGSTYYVRAYATNSYGTGYGNQITFTVSATGTVTDIDGNVYGTVTIGTQTWMTSNLRVTHYQNGDSLVNGMTYSGSINFNIANGIYLFPNNDTTQNAKYGKYYNPAALLDSRNIAPAGWHVPTDQDWYTIEFYEGLTSADTMVNSDLGLRGTIGAKFLAGGSSGLNLQLAGWYCPFCGSYKNFGSAGYYGSSTSSGSQYNVFDREFNISGTGPIERSDGPEYYSIRCVKN